MRRSRAHRVAGGRTEVVVRAEGSGFDDAQPALGDWPKENFEGAGLRKPPQPRAPPWPRSRPQPSHGLITAAPAASNRPVSVVATASPLATAAAAMWPSALAGQQRAQLRPPLRFDGGLQNLAYLGLHAVAVSGGTHAQRPVHLFGKVAHCQHWHLRPHPIAINACMMLPCLHPGPPDGRERQWPGTGRAAGVRLLPPSTSPAWMPADARAREFVAIPPKLRPALQATPLHPPRRRPRDAPPPSTLGGPRRPARSRIPAIESGQRAAQPQQETAP